MRMTSLAIALGALAILPSASAAKDKVDVSEAATQMMKVCIAAKGDKRRAEQKFGPMSGFERVQSTPQQSVATHKSKDMSFLLIMQGDELACIINFEPNSEPVESFYAFRTELASQLDVPEAEFKEEGTSIVYASDDMQIMMRWASGISTSVTFK